MSPEEFFMYLTIGLIVLVPVSARLYRYFTAGQVKRMLREEFGKAPEAGRPRQPEGKAKG
ncbi:MAG: hypothetical protein KGJ14_06625 [Nitrospirota bacterium]|nr:hypothetical protein [Nitrospirota bacterium]MDE3226371.1 hypothetical protein [Nitrospirota bacterium]